jgi:hypothetical protein
MQYTMQSRDKKISKHFIFESLCELDRNRHQRFPFVHNDFERVVTHKKPQPIKTGVNQPTMKLFH